MRTLKTSSRPFDLLRNFSGHLVYEAGEEIDPYGPGWAWDDYAHSYQVERSTFPIYGNRVSITSDLSGNIVAMPSYFSEFVQSSSSKQKEAWRDPQTNTFYVNPDVFSPGDTLTLPFIVSDFDEARMLSDTLHRTVQLSYTPANARNWIPVYGSARDSLIRQMMYASDNSIAEQLLMQAAYEQRGTFQPDSAIAFAQQYILAGAPDSILWADGSGLSRYNLCTPRSLVWALDQVRQMTSWEYISTIFPVGGHSGTLTQWYKGTPPYVYAKTGSLRNHLCLSGYLMTNSGHWLIFSFMHSDFTGDSGNIKREMERLLVKIKDAF